VEALHANGNFQKTLTLFNKRDFSPPSSSPYVFFTKLCVLCFQCFCTSLDVWIIASKNIHLSFLHLSSLSFFSILFLSISFLCTLLVSLLCHFACFIALPCRLILLPCPATSPPCCAHRCLITLLPFIALLHHTISLLHDLVAIMLQVLFDPPPPPPAPTPFVVLLPCCLASHYLNTLYSMLVGTSLLLPLRRAWSLEE
jgi:hypothetical protein